MVSVRLSPRYTQFKRGAFQYARIESFNLDHLEMTGLKPDTDVIIEIATIVTDADLRTIAEGPALA